MIVENHVNISIKSKDTVQGLFSRKYTPLSVHLNTNNTHTMHTGLQFTHQTTLHRKKDTS